MFEITARLCSAAAGCSKSLLGRASKPPRNRNHCSRMFVFLRQHSKTLHRRCVLAVVLKITAKAYATTTWRSKSLLGLAPKPLSARNRCLSKLLRSRQHSRTHPRRCCFAHSGDNPNSVVLGHHGAFEIIVGHSSNPSSARNHCSNRLSFIRRFFRFPSETLSESLCFELRIASNNAFDRYHKHRKMPYANPVSAAPPCERPASCGAHPVIL